MVGLKISGKSWSSVHTFIKHTASLGAAAIQIPTLVLLQSLQSPLSQYTAVQQCGEPNAARSHLSSSDCCAYRMLSCSQVPFPLHVFNVTPVHTVHFCCSALYSSHGVWVCKQETFDIFIPLN